MSAKEAKWKKEYSIHWDGVELDDNDWIDLCAKAFGVSLLELTTTRAVGDNQWDVYVDDEWVSTVDRCERDKLSEVLAALGDTRTKIIQSDFEEEITKFRSPEYWLDDQGMSSIDWAFAHTNSIRIVCSKRIGLRAKPEVHYRSEDEAMGLLFKGIKTKLREKLIDDADATQFNLTTSCELTRIIESRELCPTTYVG